VVQGTVCVTSAKRWNYIHGSKDHLWGERYFTRAIKNLQEYEFVMNYINQNPVVAGLSESPASWKPSGAFYIDRGIPGLVDYDGQVTKNTFHIPDDVLRLIPPRQLEKILRYYGAYTETIDNLCRILPVIPRIGETEKSVDKKTYLHYYTDTDKYLIYEYDREDTMYGMIMSSVFPDGTLNKISLAGLKKNEMIKLEVPDIENW